MDQEELIWSEKRMEEAPVWWENLEKEELVWLEKRRKKVPVS